MALIAQVNKNQAFYFKNKNKNEIYFFLPIFRSMNLH
jgi:hypothetical protein